MRRLLHDQSGASAAEFSLVLPLLILLLFGMIDTGRYMWEYNRAEKATQMGARMAVVTDVISTGLGTYDFVQPSGLTQGDNIPANAIAPITCTDDGTTSTCSCTASGASICPPGYATGSHTAFLNILDRMKAMYPNLTAANVQIIYSGSGLGYAGDPNGMDIAPLVTVRLINVKFKALTSLMLANINMPDFASTLTAEDSSGNVSN